MSYLELCTSFADISRPPDILPLLIFCFNLLAVKRNVLRFNAFKTYHCLISQNVLYLELYMHLLIMCLLTVAGEISGFESFYPGYPADLQLTHGSVWGPSGLSSGVPGVHWESGQDGTG